MQMRERCMNNKKTQILQVSGVVKRPGWSLNVEIWKWMQCIEYKMFHFSRQCPDLFCDVTNCFFFLLWSKESSDNLQTDEIMTEETKIRLQYLRCPFPNLAWIVVTHKLNSVALVR
jgi:hypothetical protein